MNLAHKIEINPNKQQREHLERCVGTDRFVYNWALAMWKQEYSKGSKPSGRGLKKQFNQTKYAEFPWLKEIPRDCHSQPFANLQKAFSTFFKTKKGYPKFKKRGRKDSFYIANDRIKVGIKKCCLPKIGWVKMTEELRFEGKLLSATVSKTAGRWFIALNVEMENYKKERVGNNKIGIDLGLKDFITTSDGEKIKPLKILYKLGKRLRSFQKSLSRKTKGSSNRKKQIVKVQRLHYKISNSRKDFLHKLSTKLVSENQAISLEDLHVSGMMKNRKLSKSISDASWSEFVRQIEYKAEIYDTDIMKVDRFYPSSKLCSACGFKNTELKLQDRKWECSNCGIKHDRDVNAAQNILGASEDLKPVEKRSDFDLSKQFSMKQEQSNVVDYAAA
jgi:putative transposase